MADTSASLDPCFPDLGEQGYNTSRASRTSGSGRKRGSTLLDSPSLLRSRSSPAEHPSSRNMHSALARLNSSYFGPLGNRSETSSQQPRIAFSSTIPPSALSFIIPMFNPDCSVRSSITPGQLEITLLRMVEAERQKGVSSGTPWQQQICLLSWLIANVQNLVSASSLIQHSRIFRLIIVYYLFSCKLNDTQLDRVFERVLTSLQETDSAPITPQYSLMPRVTTRKSSNHGRQSSATLSFRGQPLLPSEMSWGSAHEIASVSGSFSPHATQIVPTTSMYQHPHRSAVSLQTTPVLQSPAMRRRQAFSKPGTADSATSKTSSILSAAVSRHPSSLISRSQPLPFSSSTELYYSPISPDTMPGGEYFSAPGSTACSRRSSVSHEVLNTSAGRTLASGEAPPPYGSISGE